MFRWKPDSPETAGKCRCCLLLFPLSVIIQVPSHSLKTEDLDHTGNDNGPHTTASVTNNYTTADSSCNSGRKLLLREKEETQTMEPTQASGTTVVQQNSTPIRTSNRRALQMRHTAATTTSKTPASSAKRRPGDSNRQRRCRARGCTSSASYSKDGLKPAVYCGNHRKFPMIRVAHGDKTCGHEGCDRPADIGYMTQNGVIERFCSAHMVFTIVISTRIDQCKHPGCSNIPSYGVKERPLSFCSSHKRVGMFTNREGTLLVATRDGDAFSSSEDIVASAKGAGPAKVATSVKGAASAEASSKERFWSEALGEEQASRKRSRTGDELYANSGEDEKKARTSSAVANSNEARKEIAIGEANNRDLGSKGNAKEDARDSATPGRTKHDTAVPISAAAPKGAKNGNEGHRGVTSPPAELSVIQKALSTSSTSDEAKSVSRSSSKNAPRLKILHRASSSGMTPSNNVAVERHTGESSGSGGGGRRSRAPSRKALEALGLIEGEEPQLMTKEIREANAKIKKELREQRRQRRAAGLRIGLVLEAVTEEASEGACSNRGSGGEAGGSSSVEVGNVRDKRAMADDAKSVGTISSGKKRRKASTPEAGAIPRADPSSSTENVSTASSSGACPRLGVHETHNGGLDKSDNATSRSPNEAREEMKGDDHDFREHKREEVVRQATVCESAKYKAAV